MSWASPVGVFLNLQRVLPPIRLIPLLRVMMALLKQLKSRVLKLSLSRSLDVRPQMKLH